MFSKASESSIHPAPNTARSPLWAAYGTLRSPAFFPRQPVGAGWLRVFSALKQSPRPAANLPCLAGYPANCAGAGCTPFGGDTKSNHGEHLGLQHEPCSENGEYLS